MTDIQELIRNAVYNRFPAKNTGVFEGWRESDYRVGNDQDDNRVPYNVVLPNHDWRQFLVVGERQGYPAYPFDTNGCTGFSNNNLAEIQIKQQTGVEVNFSDRATNVLAECTKDGNWLFKPADIGRKVGRILERDAPSGGAKTWNEWARPLTDEEKSKIVRLHERYIWVTPNRSSLEYHLKHAPIQIIINNKTHAVVLVHIDDSGYWYFDSYPPYLKVTTEIPTSALKIVVKVMTNAKLVKKGQEFGFYLPATSEQSMLDKALNLGYVLPTLNEGKNVDWANLKPDITVQ